MYLIINKIKISLFITLLINIIFIQIANSSESYLVVKVNNKIITNIDIEIEYRYLIALNQDLKKIEKKKIMEIAKESIIREKIKETEISKYYDLSIENKFVDKIISNFYNKLKMKNELEFKNYLKKYNLSLTDVKKKISIEATWNNLIFNKFSRELEIDEKKIRKKINEIILNKKKQNMYLLSEILFNIEKNEKIKNKYKLIEKSISEIGFKNTANIYSNSDTSKLGGQIGWINETQLSKSILKKLIKLNKGEYTSPLPVPGGLLILKIDDKKKQEYNLDFDKEFKKRIEFEKNTQLDRFSKIYYKKIKKNSTISEI
ncbi:peptidylprolyl isomerase [Candidatus Pelagibacter sp.]|nr:peptidylprolyl isomerase [Candidatus Pelagibacter sp.]